MAERANVYPLRRDPEREPQREREPQPEPRPQERQTQEPLWREVLGRRLRVLRQEQQETLSETAARAALDGHADTRVRRRAVDTLLLATAHLQQNRLDEACAVGAEALDLVGRLHSARGNEYLKDFQRRLEPYRDEHVVREFAEAVHAVPV